MNETAAVDVDDPDGVVAEAEQEAAEAAELNAALEERIRGGDTSVTAEELSSAESLSRFARLRVDAARRKADAARQANALAKGRALVGELHGLSDEAQEVLDALRASATALARLESAVTAHDAEVRRLSGEIASVDFVMRRDAGVGVDSLGVLNAFFGNEDGFQLEGGKTRVAALELGRMLSVAASLGLSSRSVAALKSALPSDSDASPDSTMQYRIEGWSAGIRAIQDEAKG